MHQYVSKLIILNPFIKFKKFRLRCFEMSYLNTSSLLYLLLKLVRSDCGVHSETLGMMLEKHFDYLYIFQNFPKRMEKRAYDGFRLRKIYNLVSVPFVKNYL